MPTDAVARPSRAHARGARAGTLMKNVSDSLSGPLGASISASAPRIMTTTERALVDPTAELS